MEVPLGLEFLRTARTTDRILEVGNVLGSFGAAPHEVVDLYEHAPGVVNEDIVRYSPGHTYDRIVSISTLEHVGFDEPSRDPLKFGRAFRHLTADLLAEGGRLLATLPLGYNPSVDAFVREGIPPEAEVTCFRRISAFNEWVEVTPAGVTRADLARPYPGASALAVVTVDPAGGAGRTRR